MKGYRLDLRLPRDLSVKLERLRQDTEKNTGKRVTKSQLVILIIAQFLSRVSD